MPVRIIFDDFATNTRISGFDNLMSVIRSRNISASIIIQSLSQLEVLYGKAKSTTIVNNCDTCLYLGGQDVESARYIAVKANQGPNSILNMPLDATYLFVRGQAPRRVTKYDLRTHKAYRELPVAGANAVRKEDTWHALNNQPDRAASF